MKRQTKKKKVVFWMPSLLIGGAEKVLVDVLHLLDPEKFEITLVLEYNKCVYPNSVPQHVKLKSMFPGFSSRLLRKLIDHVAVRYFSAFLYKTFAPQSPDIEIAFLEGTVTNIVSRSKASSAKMAWVHTDMDKFRWSSQYFASEQSEENAYKCFDSIVCVSEQSRSAFFNRFSIDENRVRVIANPIRPDEILALAEQTNTVFEDFTVFSLGRQNAVKGFDRLIRAHSVAVKSFKHQLAILGDGPERESLEQLARDLGVFGSVKFLGYQENAYPFLNACDLYVNASHSEGYPISLLEALILEKPVLATDITGSREILGGGDYGKLCESTQESITHALTTALSENELEALKQKARLGKSSLLQHSPIEEIESLLLE
jgi:glycosyltransferase involved in cell wall biosynthesis